MIKKNDDERCNELKRGVFSTSNLWKVKNRRVHKIDNKRT